MSNMVSADMDPEVVVRIQAMLERVRADQGVAIPLAIESGSRAWGFPSPDSDYDCRFLFVRSERDYLSLWRKRDVIEMPVDRVFDVNGWDIGKALKLLLKGNAVVIEWLTSPITYRTDPQFRDEFLALARTVADRALIARHYLHLGERQRRTYFKDTKSIPQKKVFYVLRPAAALRWLRLHPEEAIAPMHFHTLLAQCEPPDEVARISQELMARKAMTRELDSEPLADAVGQFIDREFESAKDWVGASRQPLADEARALCDTFFARAVARFAPS